MTRITRRRFLQTIALGSGTLVAQTALDPSHTLAQTANQALGDGTIFLEGDIPPYLRMPGTMMNGPSLSST